MKMLRISDVIQDSRELLTADDADWRLCSRESQKVNFQFTSLLVLFIEQSCYVVLFRLNTHIYMQCISIFFYGRQIISVRCVVGARLNYHCAPHLHPTLLKCPLPGHFSSKCRRDHVLAVCFYFAVTNIICMSFC